MGAMRLADAFSIIVPAERGVGFRAYDGSTAGPVNADVVLDIRSPRAVQYLASAPSQLGLARAYVIGDLEIIGDAYTALSRLYPVDWINVSWADRVRLLRQFAPKAVHRPAPPPQERVLNGRRHSKNRDADAIHHHYDVSNRFYGWVLGPSMAYTCAVFATADASLEEAQDEKFDLVCRKLGLAAGDAAARRRLRLGRHGHARRQALRGQGHRRDAVRAAGRLRPGVDRAGRADRPGGDPLQRLPRRRRVGLRRRLVHRTHRAHRPRRTTRRTSASCTASCAPRAAC